MPKCPNCGHAFKHNSDRYGSAIIDGFIESIGIERIGPDLAEWYKEAGKNVGRAGPMYRMIMEMIQNEDKARIHQNFAEDVSEERERAYVIEYVLSDVELLGKINAVASKRGLIANGETVDVEYKKITSD